MANTATNKEFTTLKNEVREIKALLTDQAEETASNGIDKVTSLLSQTELKKMAHNAGNNIRDYMGEKRDQAVAAKETYEEKVHAHPFASTAIAFGVGALLVGLLKRR